MPSTLQPAQSGTLENHAKSSKSGKNLKTHPFQWDESLKQVVKHNGFEAPQSAGNKWGQTINSQIPNSPKTEKN
jgi:hypothetical protein